MNDSSSLVLVVGATGNVGSRLVPLLLERGFHVRAATREPDAYTGARTAEPVRLDLDETDTWNAALRGVQRLFLIAKNADPEAHLTLNPFIDRAREAGVRRVVLMTADGVQHDEEAGMRRAERHLERSGLEYTVIRPSWFMQNFTPGFLSGMVAGGTIYLPAEDGRSAFVDAADVASVAAVALAEEGHAGRTYTATGPEALSYGEAAEVLSEAAGRPIGYENVPEDAFREALSAQGWYSGQIDLMAGLFGAVRAGHAATVSAHVERVTGRPARALREFAEDNAARLRGTHQEAS